MFYFDVYFAGDSLVGFNTMYKFTSCYTKTQRLSYKDQLVEAVQ